MAREVTTSGDVEVDTLTHTFESPIEPGELLVVFVHASSPTGGDSLTPYPPTGYSSVGNATIGPSSIAQKPFWKVADGTETEFTIGITTNVGPMSIIAWRFTPTLGYAFDTFVTNSGAGDLGLADFDPAYLTEVTAGDLGGATVVAVAEGIAAGTVDAVSFRTTPNSYIPFEEYVDVYPGDGTNVVVPWHITSGASDSTKEHCHWAGYRLDITEDPEQTIAFGLDVESIGASLNFSTLYFSLVEDAEEEVVPTLSARYEVTSRRVDAMELPYQVTESMFSAELGA